MAAFLDLPFGLKTEPSYFEHLAKATRIAVWFNAIMLGLFTLIYLLDGFWIGFWINLVAFGFGVAAILAVYLFKQRVAAANLAVLGLYVSTMCIAPFRGGVYSPNIPWGIFLVILATFIAGLSYGVIWGGITILTMFALFLAQTAGWMEMGIGSASAPDYLIEYLALLVCASVAIIWNEDIKRKKYKRLEEYQQHLSHLANIDNLTSVFNRRYYQDYIENTPQSGAILILLDIDEFKHINDTYGHEIGDQVLVEITKLINKNLRRNDVLIRLGGDEFVILMPETTLEWGVNVAQRLRSTIEQTPIETKKGMFHLTASFGVAHAGEQDELSASELLHSADQAMYAAKQAGRNQIYIWENNEVVSGGNR